MSEARTTARPQRPPVPQRPASFVRYLRRATRRRRGLFGDGTVYQVVVFFAFFGFGPVMGAVQYLTRPAPARPVLAWPAAAVLLVSGAGVVGLVAALLGPVTASREWRGWVLSTPLIRGPLLRGRALLVLALAVIPGGIIGAVLAGLSGLRRGDAVAAIALSALLAVIAAAAAVADQYLRRTQRPRLWVWIPAVLAPMFVARAFQDERPAHPSSPVLWMVTALVAVLAGVLAACAVAGVGRIPLAGLVPGAGSVGAVGQAAFDQSLGSFTPLVSRQKRRSEATAGPLRGTAMVAAGSMVRRLIRRNRDAQIRLVVMMAVPWALTALAGESAWGTSLLAIGGVLAGIAAISGFTGPARQFGSSIAVAAQYGLDRSRARTVAFRWAIVAAAVWGTAACGAFLFPQPHPVSAVLVPVVALLVVGARVVQPAFRPSFVMVRTLSMDTVRQFVRGPALLLAGCLIVGLVAARTGR